MLPSYSHLSVTCVHSVVARAVDSDIIHQSYLGAHCVVENMLNPVHHCIHVAGH